MKRYRKLFLVFLLIISVLITVAYILSGRIARKGLPKYNGTVALSNLMDTVEVYRDAFGTPHIIAQNEEDLYRAVGYVMAQDRLWQMDLLRRVTLGRLSEIFGDSFVETDLLLRSLQYSKKSKELLLHSPTKVINALEAFTDGVNQYIAEQEGNYPLEFTLLQYKPEKWEPYQSLNLIGYMAWDLKAGWNELVLEDLKNHLDNTLYSELLPNQEQFSTTVFNAEHAKLLSNNSLLQLDKLSELGLDVLSGSNNWAVAGKKSVTGKPILANDMHLSFGIPGIWMQMHQTIPGVLNVSGLALPGQPLIIVGHNDSIAWGMTNTYVDNLDYYEEKINPDNKDQYFFEGQWFDFDVYNEEIKSSSDSVFRRTYRRSHRGPIVSEYKGVTDKVLSIHWVGDEPSNELLSIYKVNRAYNWKTFKDAFRTFRSISQNIAYADINGNIGLYACVGVPVRKRRAVFEILPGWVNDFDWYTMLPFDKLPHEYNPERGYVSSANNKTIDASYPYHIGTWYAMPYRIDRIRELLEAKEKLSVDDFKLIQNDYQSKLAERFIKTCLPLIDVSESNKMYHSAFTYFQNWEGAMDKNLVAPTLFEATLFSLVENTFKDEMGEELFERFKQSSNLVKVSIFNLLESQEESVWLDNINTPEKENLNFIVNQSFIDAVDLLAQTNGRNIENWKWKNLHQITLSHPLSKKEALDKAFNLNRGPYSVNGSNNTVAPYSFEGFNTSNITRGASHRHIYSLDNWDKTQSVIPTGNSGVVSSEFYCSQTEMYMNGEYHDDVFSDEAVKQNYKYKLVLVPKE
jgi:penicillin G amidase